MYVLACVQSLPKIEGLPIYSRHSGVVCDYITYLLKKIKEDRSVAHGQHLVSGWFRVHQTQSCSTLYSGVQLPIKWLIHTARLRWLNLQRFNLAPSTTFLMKQFPD